MTLTMTPITLITAFYFSDTNFLPRQPKSSYFTSYSYALRMSLLQLKDSAGSRKELGSVP